MRWMSCVFMLGVSAGAAWCAEPFDDGPKTAPVLQRQEPNDTGVLVLPGTAPAPPKPAPVAPEPKPEPKPEPAPAVAPVKSAGTTPADDKKRAGTPPAKEKKTPPPAVAGEDKKPGPAKKPAPKTDAVGPSGKP